MNDRLRSISPSDLNLICEHRERMFAESGRDRTSLKPMTDAFRDWLRPRLDDKSYFGWIIERDGRPAAAVGMMVIDWPPHPSHLKQERRGYVLNMYVEPDHRHRGLARRLMEMVRAEAQALELDYVTLHATRQGRPLYERLGWTPTAELGLHITPPLPIDVSTD
jgi:ribosomal protein S18 acetylase RimI-like enzyme